MQKEKEALKQEFKEFYKQEIVPILKKYEKGRGMDVSTFKNFFIPFGLIFFFAFLSAYFGSLNNFLLAKLFLLSAFGSFVYIFIALSKSQNPNVKKTKTSSSVSYSFTVDLNYEKPLKEKLAQGFINIFGCKFSWTKELDKADDNKKIEDKLKTLNIFPKFGIIRFDDVITGLYNDVYIQIVELSTGLRLFDVICLTILLIPFWGMFSVASGKGNNGLAFFICVFFIIFMFFVLRIAKINLFNSSIKGLTVTFKFPKKFKGHTFIIEKAITSAKLHLKDIGKYQTVNLESPEFNEKFKVYSNDQIEARYLLTTAFMQRFEEIKMAFEAKYIRAEFKDGELNMLMGVDKDLFKMGSFFEESSYHTFLQVFEEIYSVLYLTTYFKLDENTGL